MQRTMEVKVEPQYLCSGCLSSDRLLLPLDANFELFNCLLEMNPQTMSAPTNLCWECTAILKKIKNFQQKIKLAQSVLQNYLYEDFHTPQFSLSSLTEHHIDKVDVVCSFNDDKNIIDDNKIATRAVRKPNENLKDRSRKKNSCQSFVEDSKKHIQKVEANEGDETSADFKVELLDVKSERADDLDDDGDFDRADSDYVFESEAVTNNNRKRKPRKQHAFSYAAHLVKHNDIDMANYTAYFKNVRLTKEQMENLGIPLKSLEFRYKLKNDAVCEECNKYFNCNVNYSRHMVFVHDAKNMLTTECQMCSAKIQGSEALKHHWLSHNQALECTLCSELGPAEKYYMRAHMHRHHMEIYCKHCPGKVRLSSLKELKHHYVKYHTNVVCDYCKQTFKTKHKLYIHMTSIHLPIQCKICKKVFKSRRILHGHMALHEVPKAPELAYCVECNKQFSNIKKYRNHLAHSVVHNPYSRKVVSIPCPECGKEFKKRAYMNNHYDLIHRKQTKHYCELCDKYFVTAWAIKTHNSSVHQKMRLPKTKMCGDCGRSFSTNAILSKHMRTHTGERPYKCSQCPAAFSQKHPLKSHMRTQHKLELQ